MCICNSLNRFAKSFINTYKYKKNIWEVQVHFNLSLFIIMKSNNFIYTASAKIYFKEILLQSQWSVLFEPAFFPNKDATLCTRSNDCKRADT